MHSKDFFYTVKTKATGLYKEKGSSFISMVSPMRDAGDLKQIISELKKEHPKARHICYAFRSGPDPDYHRLYDDGEPSGTAGRPILGQLIKFNLENTLITVVRYFGGTLLGAAGLGTAYKSAAENAISNAEIIQSMRQSFFEIEYNYSSEKFIEFCLKKLNGVTVSKLYKDSIIAIIAFPISQSETLIQAIYNLREESNWKEEMKIKFLYKDSF
jgi:uncharacterized YigZ family protein